MKIAIYFPGVGYHADKPLLYYSRDIAREAGYEENRNIAYTCSVKKIRGDMDKMKRAFEELYMQAEDALKDIRWDEYDDVLFVSKSIGTVIAITYALKHDIKNARQVLYTPLAETFTATNAPKDLKAVAFIGTKDPWSDAAKVVELAEALNIPIHQYEGVNHSLEGDDTLKNLEIIRDVMTKTKDWIG